MAEKLEPRELVNRIRERPAQSKATYQLYNTLLTQSANMIESLWEVNLTLYERLGKLQERNEKLLRRAELAEDEASRLRYPDTTGQ